MKILLLVLLAVTTPDLAYLTGHFYATNGQSKYCIYSQTGKVRIYVRTVDMGIACPETTILTGAEKWRKINYT
jgi:hypothetical protein